MEQAIERAKECIRRVASENSQQSYTNVFKASENWDIGTYRNYKKNIQIAMRQSIS
jgi:hypothetical protein